MPPDLGRRVAQRPAVREVAGGDLVHGDGRQAGAVEDGQPLLLLLRRPVRVGRCDVVPGGRVRLVGRGPGHHRGRPALGRRGGPDPALPVQVRHQAPRAGELDDLGGQFGRLGDHPVRVRMVGQQLRHDLGDRAARIQRPAGLGQQVRHPLPFAVGDLGERGQVDVQALLRAHQRGEGRAAQPCVGVAGLRGPRDVGDQPGVRGQRGVRLGALRRVEAGGQSAHRVQQRAGHRRVQPVERADGGVHRLRPLRQMAPPGPARAAAGA